MVECGDEPSEMDAVVAGGRPSPAERLYRLRAPKQERKLSWIGRVRARVTPRAGVQREVVEVRDYADAPRPEVLVGGPGVVPTTSRRLQTARIVECPVEDTAEVAESRFLGSLRIRDIRADVARPPKAPVERREQFELAGCSVGSRPCLR
jgi:hypothetical protein